MSYFVKTRNSNCSEPLSACLAPPRLGGLAAVSRLRPGRGPKRGRSRSDNHAAVLRLQMEAKHSKDAA